jgi:GNAT superfamily N-acetyltransferase
MKIRVATLADLAGIVACADLAFETSPLEPFQPHGGPNDDLKSVIQDGSIYVIYNGAMILGYISFWPIADHLFVDSVAVLPDCRGRGLGTLLLAFAEHEAARLGLRSVRPFTKQMMADNFSFYRHRGYCETGRCDDDGFPRVFYSEDVSHRAAALGKSEPSLILSTARPSVADAATFRFARGTFMSIEHHRYSTAVGSAKALADEVDSPTVEPVVESKIRKCLRCRLLFPSAWSGERICRRCKSTAAWRSSVLR